MLALVTALLGITIGGAEIHPERTLSALVDLGTVIEGQQLVTRVPIKNRTSRELSLPAAQGGCGSLFTEQRAIPPFAQRMLGLHWDTRGLRGFTRRSVSIPIGQGTGFLQIEIEATVEQGFRVAPRAVVIAPGETVRLEITGPVMFRLSEVELPDTELPLLVGDSLPARPAKRQAVNLTRTMKESWHRHETAEIRLHLDTADGRFTVTVPARLPGESSSEIRVFRMAWSKWWSGSQQSASS